jgi:cytochrome P450
MPPDKVIRLDSYRDPENPLEPNPVFVELRSHQPVLDLPQDVAAVPGRVSVLTRYEDVRALLAASGTSTRPSDPSSRQPGFLLSLDPPDHTRIRRLLIREFSNRRLNRLRPWIQEIVDRLLTDLAEAGPPTDLMQAFALPVPAMVICELLGVPYLDRHDFQRRSDTMLDPTRSAQEHAANLREMNAYMRELVEVHRANQDDSLLGTLVHQHSDELTDEEAVGVGNILLLAGHETTANTIGLGTLLLLRHPDQLALIRDNPDGVTAAVEEILRYLTIVSSGSPRLVTEEIEIGGQHFSAGDLITVALPSANRDDTLLVDPDVFDVTRVPGPHIAFGHGIHQCLGQQLARMELAIAFPALFRAFPELKLAVPETELQFRLYGAVNGLRSLPVTW